MLLTGTFVRSMDEKQRIALPKRIRDAFDGTDAATLFITPGNDGSLAIYAEQALQALAERLGTASPTRQDVRTYSRLFYSRAERLELDDQSRFRVPANLVQLAGLEKEIVLVGVRDHVEIWNRTKWEAFLAASSADYDRLAEQAFGAPPVS